MTQHRPRELIGPPGAFAFTPDRDVCPSRSQDIECQFPQDREVFRPVILAISSAILVKAHIKDPMQTGLYPPVRAHREYLRGRFQRFTRNLVVLHGGMTAAARAAAKAMLDVPDGQERLILATGRYLGEGFDDSRLDTLFLTMPISWKGTLAQYVGRLHREHQGKNEVLVYDYTDSAVPVLARMATRRGAGYRALGYVVTLSPAPSTRDASAGQHDGLRPLTVQP